MNSQICINCGKQLTVKQIQKGNKFCCKGCATAYRCKAHDPDIFLIKDQDVLYYFIGLIFSDGNLDKNSSRITLGFIDKEFVEKIYPLFSDTKKRKIYVRQFKKENSFYSIINSNSQTIEKLKQLGLSSANSTNKTMPLIPKEHFGAFMRGIFDGDGCFYISRKYKNKNYYAVSITCGSLEFTKAMMESLKEFNISTTMSIDCRKKIQKNKTYYIHIYKKESITKFKELIYKHSNMFLLRKWEKFQVI